MTRAGRTAQKLRWLLLGLGIAFELLAIGFVMAPLFKLSVFAYEPAGLLGTPFIIVDVDETGYLVHAIAVIGLLVLAQWYFLRPSRLLPIRLTARGRPLKASVIVASAMAMLLTLGAVTLVLELFGVWAPIMFSRDPRRTQPMAAQLLTVFLAIIVIWGLWMFLFHRYWRDGDRYTQLGRMVRALVAGSVLEAIVAAPAQAYASRQSDCHCERGSYTTLVCSGAVLFWAFGPGIVLLFLRENYRRARLFPRCHGCGYDLRGSVDRCPECGRQVLAGERPGAIPDEENAKTSV